MSCFRLYVSRAALCSGGLARLTWTVSTGLGNSTYDTCLFSSKDTSAVRLPTPPRPRTQALRKILPSLLPRQTQDLPAKPQGAQHVSISLFLSPFRIPSHLISSHCHLDAVD